MMKRDRRRWTAADSDGDDKLTKEEFASFLHPEESEHMRDIVVQETMEDIDKNSDGQVRFVHLMSFTTWIQTLRFVGFTGRVHW